MSDVTSRVRGNLAAIEPYQPGLSDETLRRTLGDRRIIKLNSNENALGPSPLALEAIRRELPRLHLYPDGASDLVREAIARHHGVLPDQVLVGNGSDDIIKLISETFLEPGDEIVVPHPSFSQYGFGAQVMDASVRPVPLTSDFTYDVDAIAEAVTPRTKIVYLCTPNNPTGTVMKQAEFDALIDRIPGDVFVVVDMAYDNYALDASRLTLKPEILHRDNVGFLFTFSKLYGLAGLRVGYLVAHPNVIQYIHRVREPFNVNRVAQVGAIAALDDVDHVRRSQALASEARYQYGKLVEHGLRVVPSEANFCLVEVGDGRAVFEALMRRAILVRTGFRGLESYVRITFGTSEENALCIAQLLEVMGKAQ
ncbi:histidinol-phosphate transaminase [Alicyclobacillus vulcanalis]|uniref:Histidinol-phosphate aminotransferase n=1 Tax=Alicyclobacillus vulcanalis TaxID=252246 RepID=A0A1N7KST5_9BACL|nr:histidinol-phosphate transaminase [Alicyclobacillus vulcanalis]SIS64611.1 histidinol-phosphate aminotransferase [Alicyclobacillus vulcanalis]